MKGLFKVLFAFIVFSAILPMGAALAQGKRDPDAAYDPVNNRYLMVWEESDGANTNILAQFRNPDGSVGAGAPTLISVPRPTQGCFYGQFDSHNGDITTPTDCPGNKNPSVAFNNGQYIVVWEVHGTAGAPSSAPDNQFINLFAKVIDANTLNPLSGWEEGILISKVFIAANNAESRCGDRHACNDSQIQAWSKSINPDVAPRVGGQGFVVTWQTNKDFIGCADADRRRGWAVYGRYIDQNFSATSTTNPPAFAVFKDDSTMADSCEPTSNVDNGSNPRIAVNQTSNDFVIAYEVARASGGNASIGAKRVTLDGSNVGQVNGNIMPDLVASVSGSSLNNPEVVSYGNQYVVFASDGSNIRGKAFSSSSISSSAPSVIDLSGGSKINVRAASNLGIGGVRPAPNSSPERILIAYQNGGNIFVATLREDLSVAHGPENISAGMSVSNRAVEVSSDERNFIASWDGLAGGEEQVFVEFVSSEDGGTTNVPPTAPVLLTPINGVTFAPIRAYLSWNASTDTDGGTITYRLYFGETVVPATPQVTGLTQTQFVIGPETQVMTGITLLPGRTYRWKIEADDGQGGVTSSPTRTLITDSSVVGWWRFDEDPTGPVCAGGGVGESVCDSSGNNNHGVPSGGPTWLPPPSIGVLGGAIDFDGINDKIDVLHDLSLDIGTEMSISCKITFASASSNTAFLTKDNPSDGPYAFRQTTANNIGIAVRTTTTWKEALADATPFLGSNLRATGTYNGININIYFNENVQNTVSGTGTVLNNTNNLKIGFDPFWNGFLTSIVDECIIFNKSLVSSEILNLVNSDN
ncbi:LamG domain-containing protein [Deltaproteobacteria bacterium PRO3]|nr:LamG domain-containing protein [Deltaproteobacteria bacterium PRO3]